MNIADVLMFLHPQSAPLVDWTVEQEADGIQSITAWKLDTPRPAMDELAKIAASDEFSNWLRLRESAQLRRKEFAAKGQAARAELAALDPTTKAKTIAELAERVARLEDILKE